MCLPLMANPVTGFLRAIFGGEKPRAPDELTAQSVSFYVAREYREAHLLGENPDYGPARKLAADCLAAINAAGVGTGHSINSGGFSPEYGGQFEFFGPDARAIFDCIRESSWSRGLLTRRP
jgi:hypothetical protein